jgi:glycine C-acetyltransferase
MISIRKKPAMNEMQTSLALSRSTAHFANPKGRDLFDRLEGFADWHSARRVSGYWPYARVLGSSPLPEARIGPMDREASWGINLAVQDYLALAAHPAVRDAAIRAVHDFGLHSAGSAILLGNNPLSLALEQAIAELVGMEHVMLFPTGWGAGFGVVNGLVRERDHIVLDALAHACLQSGTMASTRNIHRYRHLDGGHAAEILAAIRARDTENAILVIAEGLYSMDSDSPDLPALQAVCREYDARLVVDVAHDLGATGPGGAGQLGAQDMLGKVDIVMGAFSKTFAANGGFIAVNDRRVKSYLQVFAGPHTFSNALSPIQCGVITECIRIVRDAEGEQLRARLQTAATEFRADLSEYGMTVLGAPSAIVPVLIGRDRLARMASKNLAARGTFTNLVEFPAVGVGAARFRCQLMATHERHQLARAASDIAAAVREAESGSDDARAAAD